MSNVVLAAQDELEEMVSYRKNVTGINHTIFISPMGNARHAPRLKVAIDPPDSVNPYGYIACVRFDGVVVSGKIKPRLLRQLKRFIEQNRAVLLEYWDYRIDTAQLQQRLIAIKEEDKRGHKS